MRHYGYRRNARVAAVDEHAVTELVIFANNDGDLYRSQKTPIIENLAKKLAKGQFDASKAAKAFSYLAEDAAKKYAWEFGDRKPGTRSWHAQGADGNGLFNAPTRRAAAKHLLESNMGAIEDRARELAGARRRNPRAHVRDEEPATVSGSFAFGRIGGKFWEAARLYEPSTKSYHWAVSGVHTAADRAAALAQLPDPNRRTNRARRTKRGLR